MTTMRTLLMLLLACAAAACASPFGAGGGVRLVNESGNAVLYLAMSTEQAAVIDPNPEWRIEEHLERLLEPGESHTIHPNGYSPGDDVFLLIYDVPGPQRTGPVRLSRSMTVTHGKLALSFYRITIPPR